MHVRGHSRGGRHGTIDVSAYDRSPPGGGAADSGDRAWNGIVTQSSAMPSPRPSAALNIAITGIGSMMLVAAEVRSAGINYASGC